MCGAGASGKLTRGDSISLFLRSLADVLECGTEVFMENIMERIVLKAQGHHFSN